MQQAHVICAVQKRLQSFDALAEEQRGRACCNADHQSDEPELNLRGAFLAQHFKTVPTGRNRLREPLTNNRAREIEHGVLRQAEVATLLLGQAPGERKGCNFKSLQDKAEPVAISPNWAELSHRCLL